MLGLFKSATVALSVTLLFRLRRQRLCELAAWGSVAILVGVLFMWHAYSIKVTEPAVIHLAQHADVYGDSWLMLD